MQPISFRLAHAVPVHAPATVKIGDAYSAVYTAPNVPGVPVTEKIGVPYAKIYVNPATTTFSAPINHGSLQSSDATAPIMATISSSVVCNCANSACASESLPPFAKAASIVGAAPSPLDFAGTAGLGLNDGYSGLVWWNTPSGDASRWLISGDVIDL